MMNKLMLNIVHYLPYTIGLILIASLSYYLGYYHFFGGRDTFYYSQYNLEVTLIGKTDNGQFKFSAIEK